MLKKTKNSELIARTQQGRLATASTPNFKALKQKSCDIKGSNDTDPFRASVYSSYDMFNVILYNLSCP